MAIIPAIKKNWIEIQKKYDYPVNAIGIRIPAGDDFTLRVWRQEGIDAYVKGREDKEKQE